MSLDSTLQHTGAEVSVEWKIGGFLSLQKNFGYRLESPIFGFSDAQWRILIYPNGRPLYRGWLCLYLYRERTSYLNHNLQLTLGIRKRDGSDFKSKDCSSEFCEVKTLSGWDEFVEISKLHDKKDVVLQEGALMVFCTARDSTKVTQRGNVAIEKASQTPPLKGVDILQRNFTNLFITGHHSDATVKVQNQDFRVHRLILATRSPVLFSMFDHDTEEKRTGIVTINDFQPNTIRKFLNFLYSAKVDIASYSDAIDLYKAADKYALEDLKELCIHCLTEQLSKESICSVLLLATMYDESELLKTATTFFIENVQDILATAEWQSWGKEHFTITNELFIKLTSKK